MLIRLGLNVAVHAAAGVAVAGLACIAAEGWRRAYRAGKAPELDRFDRRSGGPAGDTIVDEPPLEDEPPAPGPREAGPSDPGTAGTGPEPGPR